MSEGMEALRHIATTSLFLQNEKHIAEEVSAKSNVPIIKEPDKPSGKFKVFYYKISILLICLHFIR